MKLSRDTTAKNIFPVSVKKEWTFYNHFRKIFLQWQGRAAIKRLLSHEDEHLDDIGLTRKDVLVALYIRSDPGEYLRKQANERRFMALSSQV